MIYNVHGGCDRDGAATRPLSQSSPQTIRPHRGVRVLMLNPSFSASEYTHNLCNALVGAGCEVKLFTSPEYQRASRCWREITYTPEIAFYRRTQLPSYRAGRLTRPAWRFLRLAGHLTSLARLRRVIRRYDVLHLHFPPVLPVDARWLQLIRRHIPVVHTVHNLWPHASRRDARDRHRLQRLYHACHQLIAHTENTARGLIEEFGVPPERIARIPHGNFRQFWDQKRVSVPGLATAATHPPTILMLGELRRSKGADVLLRAAATLRDRGVAFRLVLAGAPFAATQPFRDLTRELALEDRVMFHLQYIEEEALPSYFEAASVVALPYRVIDQSGVAIAAVTMGRAIVATRIGGLVELVEQGDCGLLVPVDDAESLATALQHLLTDDGLRQRFERNARRYAETALAWEPIAERTIDVYRKGFAADPARESRSHRRALMRVAEVSS
jgi:glycosyltransferase involved in cell wall biosynthesis